jgi:menaquinol-cytochrome c reductase iron-sulfur subunit
MSMNRRDFHGSLTMLLGGLMTLILAVPGVAYLLDPVLKKKKTGNGGDEGYTPLVRLSGLTEGRPQSFPVEAARTDAWVKYPKEPVGSVWLIRQPAGAKERVVAFTAECPHLGCGVEFNGHDFACPCHTSAFKLDGTPLNQVPPRGMDRLEVKLDGGDDPWVRVRFQRFRSQTEEKIPLA